MNRTKQSYPAEMSLSQQSKQDKKRIKKHNHQSKKCTIEIPELRLLILDDKPDRAERLEKIIRGRMG